MAWIFPSMRTSFSWLIWSAANGAPNCFLSCKYLPSPPGDYQNPSSQDTSYQKPWSTTWKAWTCHEKVFYQGHLSLLAQLTEMAKSREHFSGHNLICEQEKQRIRTCLWQTSYTPMAMPIGCHATIMRDTANTCKKHHMCQVSSKWPNPAEPNLTSEHS